jgi:DNA adenine methylase
VASAITQPLKWFGGKNYLAKRIIDMMPPHLHYVEAFLGGAAVLMARDPDDPRWWLPPHRGISEIVNDLNGRLINFWRVLQDEALYRKFARRVEAIPMSRAEWDRAHDGAQEGAVDDAVAFFVDCRQSRAGMMRDFTSITRSRTRRQMNGNVSEWLGAVNGLAYVHARLSRVLIEHGDGIDLITREDTPHTLFYVDPPYLHVTRTTTNGYAHEMSEAEHIRLATVLNRIKGKAILSGYPSTLYDGLYAGWRRVEIDLPNNAAGGRVKARETEVLWLNYPLGDQAMSS